GGAAAGGRAAVHEAFLARAVAAGERPAGLPRRVVVFGISSMPRQSLEVLATLARWCQVLVCVPNPCRHHWADIVADKDLLRRERARQARKPGMPAVLDETTLHLHAQPLLAAWGKQGRDFIALLDEVDSAETRREVDGRLAAIGQRVDLFDEGAPDSLLGQLQDDILELRPLDETRSTWPAVDLAADRSIRFHVAHGPQREVEILHDQLLAAFDAEPDLRPRDIIVMVPDIDAYAPHIQAVFGLPGTDDPRHIPFSLADQGRRGEDPLLCALEQLLGLPESRLGVSAVLDLLDVPALRRRFGIDAADLPQLQAWIRDSGVRWGLHAAQRATLDLPREAEPAAPNSWLSGLRRMLLGYAAGPGAPAWQGIEPFDEVGGLGAAALGPLLRLLGTLEQHWQALATPADVPTWVARLRALHEAFFVAEGDDEAFALLQLESGLQTWQEAAAEARLEAALPLSVVREHWLSGLDEGGLSQRFFAGAVTFATLMPMRAIPFRRVCLLGMNDGDYPRSRPAADFDLMGQDYRPGDRSRREDDRYLFLEALLAARDHLHVSWVGRSIRDNASRPPSVLVGQLREHLAAGWRLAGADDDDGGAALLAALTVEHPLQPFGAAYFQAPDGAGSLFTYAREWQPAGSQAPAPTEAPLPPIERDEPLDLDELGAFLQRPVRAFFNRRLGVWFEADAAAEADLELFAPDALGRWALQARLIEQATRDVAGGGEGLPAARDEVLAMARRGELPAGGFGSLWQETLLSPLPELLERYRACLARWPGAADDLPVAHACRVDGRAWRLEDAISGLRRGADGTLGRIELIASDLVVKGHYRLDLALRPWVTHLGAQLGGEAVTTELISKVGQFTFAPMPAEAAAAHLDTLIAAWDAGMRRPLPLAVKAGFEWLRTMPPDAPPHTPQDKAFAAARRAYEGDAWNPGERDRCAALARAWPDFDALWAGGEFGALAVALLRPLRETMGRPPRGGA
ncbi:MAG: exodeoxyribonuclease V subunit gamma, partial [Rhodocyclaceae bacterium]|nr:exodeoxyribonuclease V subunit gamma [Rhodocyclaceae bacterium]